MWLHQGNPVCNLKNHMIQFKSMKLEDIKSEEPNSQCWKDCKKHLVNYHLDMETHAIWAHDSSHQQKCWSSLWVCNFLVQWWIGDENQTNEKNNEVTANQREKRKRKAKKDVKSQKEEERKSQKEQTIHNLGLVCRPLSSAITPDQKPFCLSKGESVGVNSLHNQHCSQMKLWHPKLKMDTQDTF